MKFDIHGRLLPDTTGMMFPVQHVLCGNIHDSADVKIISRWADCDIWECPNCGRQCDNRPIGWGGNVRKLYK